MDAEMDAKPNTWKLQDAKARFSEVVRRARGGEPQRVTLHGREAVVVVDPERFEVRPKPPEEATLAGFVERSKKYRARNKSEEIEFDEPVYMDFPDRPLPGDNGNDR
jgi:prevent-host-death family protein